jgi:hypothetical protein
MASQSRSSAATGHRTTARSATHQRVQALPSSQQLAGFKVLEQPAISARSGMVKLVDDDDVEVIGDT